MKPVFICLFWCTLFIPVFLYTNCDAQGSVRITVQSGGNVSFVFNSIAKYKNGITYTNWTSFGIAVEDTGVVTTYPNAWKLEFKDNNADGDGLINGSGVNTLLLNTLRITGTVNASLAAKGAVSFGPLPLTIADQKIAEDLSIPNAAGEPVYPPNLVLITYACGTVPCPCPPGNTLLGRIPDYYVVDIEFTLTGCFPAPCP